MFLGLKHPSPNQKVNNGRELVEATYDLMVSSYANRQHPDQ